MHTFLYLQYIFSLLFLLFFFCLFIRCILFSAYFLPSFFCICRPRSGRLRPPHCSTKRPSAPREAAGEKPGDPHKQRLCEGFIFLKIFLKSSQAFFILFFILYIFQHIIYVKEMKKT